MATLQENIRQASSDFQAIKAKIVEKGVEVADGTPTSEYASKIDAVYEAAKQKEYDDFWDTFQQNGKRYTYDLCSFGGASWYDERFKPKYDITLRGNCNYAFANSKIIDFKGCIEKAGINFSTNGLTIAQNLFSYSTVENLPTIDISQCTGSNATNAMFSNASQLKSIDKIIVSANTRFYNNTFASCYALEEIRFEGTINCSISFMNSTKLSKASIISIVNALKDEPAGLYDAHLSQTAIDASFTTDEWNALIATKPNWTICDAS